MKIFFSYTNSWWAMGEVHMCVCESVNLFEKIGWWKNQVPDFSWKSIFWAHVISITTQNGLYRVSLTSEHDFDIEKYFRHPYGSVWCLLWSNIGWERDIVCLTIKGIIHYHRGAGKYFRCQNRLQRFQIPYTEIFWWSYPSHVPKMWIFVKNEVNLGPEFFPSHFFHFCALSQLNI